jgi:chromosome segregation ATPase
MSLTADEIATLAALLDEKLSSFARRQDVADLRSDMEIGFRDLSQRMVAVEKASVVIAQSLVKLTARVEGIDDRLARLEERVEQIDSRLGRLSDGLARARTTDAERLAALEARVAELEARLSGKH